ncbi:MAG: DHA2 family efflux MFS transporter permease subunit [Gemmatimonadetes bacterium]|nr:DHA2 family efflux MFS transporter permease subunit [Gemmatimonadota bacterium]
MATAALPQPIATPAAPALSEAERKARRKAQIDADPRYANRYLIAIAVTMSAVLELIDTSIVNVAIPHMMGNLGATLDEISWVSTGYIIANVIVIPMSSWLSSYFGRRRYLTGSILLFVTASFFCGAATSLGGLVLWRVIQGLGGGALLSTAQSTLFEAFPPEEVGVGQAMFGVGVMVGPTVGPTLGGYIVDNLSWPWIFYINVPLGILAALMTWTYVRNSAFGKRAATIDVGGIVLLTLAVGALQWMLERGERFDWFENGFITSLAAIAGTSALLLVWWELRVPEPVINFRVLKSRQLATGVMFAGSLGLALYGSVFVIPVFLQNLHGYTAQQTGLVILPGAIASAITMATLSRRIGTFDARITIVAGVFLFFGCMLWMSNMTLESGADEMFWPLIIRGFAMGLIFVPLTNASMAELAPQDIPQGTGMFNLMRQLGGSMGIAVIATLLGRFTKVGKALLSEHVTNGDPATMERLNFITRGLQSRGIDAITAKQQALALLDRGMTAQATVLGFSKIYLISGTAFVCALPLLLLWKHGKGRQMGGGAAH